MPLLAAALEDSAFDDMLQWRVLVTGRRNGELWGDATGTREF